MPFAPVELTPGVNVERTPTLNEAGYSQSNLIRWKDKLAQKIGGWVSYYANPVAGIPRCLHAWQDLNETGRLAIGTTQELDVLTSGVITQITPQKQTTNVAPNFDTTINSKNVTVTDSGVSGITILDSVYFNTPVSVGGLILSGVYPVIQILSSSGAAKYVIQASKAATANASGAGTVPSFSVTNGFSNVTVTLANHGLSSGQTINFPIPTVFAGVQVLGTYTVLANPPVSPNTFVISANTTATSTAVATMNSGQVQFLYDITLGPLPTGQGYGVGGYGTGAYGYGTAPSQQSGAPITATDWSLDNWGSDLISCPQNGGLYFWEPTGGNLNVQLIANAPYYNGGCFVSMPAQILVAWGSTAKQDIGIDQDPLLIKWSDQLDYTNWEPSTTSQAGSFHIPTGSKIVGALQGPQYALIWTDLDVWSMQYVGYPLVFGFNKIGSSCGLISSKGAAQLGGQVFWMGNSNFFTLTGSGATVLPCPVWDQVFQNIDTNNLSKVRAAANTVFNEIWWFYPSLNGNGENDSYVKLNIQEGAWDYGSLQRSAWIDQSVLGNPIATTSNGIIYQHEVGQNAAGLPIASSFTTGYVRIDEGSNIVFIDQIIPDMKWKKVGRTTSANVLLTFYSQNYPSDTPITYGPYSIDETTQQIYTRIRGRQVAMKLESADLGSFWRLGKITYRYAVDGRR